MSGKKLLCIYPTGFASGVQRFVKDLYEGLRGMYEVELVGVWFDEEIERRGEDFEVKYRVYNVDGYKKDEIKKEFENILNSSKPDIIHLNTFAIDIDVLQSIYKYRRDNPSTRLVYTVHSLAFQDFSRNPEYRELFNVNSEYDEFVNKLVEISGINSLERDLYRKIQMLKDLLIQFNLSPNEERLKTLDIISYMMSLQTNVLRISDAVVFVSEFLKNSAFNNPYLEKIIRGKAHVIRNSTKLYLTYEKYRDTIRSEVERWRKENSLTDKFIIGYFGRIVESKGVIDLIEVVREIVKDGYLDVVLILGGPISYVMEKKIIRNFGDLLYKNLLLFDETLLPTPLSPKADIRTAMIYSSFDLFVYPSYYETFGLAPIEAVSCETPVIVRRIDNLLEFEKDGIVKAFSTKDELKTLILRYVKKEVKENREDIEERRRKVKEKYGIERMINDYEKLYNGLVGGISLSQPTFI